MCCTCGKEGHLNIKIKSVSCRSCLIQVWAPDHWDHSSQHLGPVPAGAAAGLWLGGDPSFVLERLAARTLAHQDLLQGVQTDDGEGRRRGEPGGRHGGGQGTMKGLQSGVRSGFTVFAVHSLVSLQEVRKISESIKYNHPLRKYVDTILRKVSGIQINH